MNMPGIVMTRDPGRRKGKMTAREQLKQPAGLHQKLEISEIHVGSGSNLSQGGRNFFDWGRYVSRHDVDSQSSAPSSKS